MASDVHIQLGGITDSHIYEAVALHRAQLSGGFMTSLGPRFLREVITNLVCSRHGVSLIAVEDQTGRLVGFLFGTTNAKGLFRDFLRRHAVRAAFAAFPRILTPRNIRRMLETLLYPSKRTDAALPEGELLDLTVDDRAKGTGLAQRLFASFADAMKDRGCPTFRITTGESLTRAHRFYEGVGAVHAGEIEVHRGSKTRIYVYTPNLP